MTDCPRSCRMVRQRELDFIQKNALMQSYLRDSWSSYQAIVGEFRPIYNQRPDLLFHEMIVAMEDHLKGYDYFIGLRRFCNEAGHDFDSLVNLLARFFWHWDDLSQQPWESA